LRSHSILRWFSIIGALCALLALQGCSAVRLAYNNAPQLSYWWLDSYFDFDATQTPRVRTELQSLQDWHRKQELPLLEQQLDRLLALAPQTITPEQVCGVYGELQTRAVAALDNAAQTLAATASSLQEPQIQRLHREFEKKDSEWREDWLEGTPQDRAERRLKKAVEWSESFYGTLSDEQRDMLAARFSASLFDPQVQHREKLRRHQDLMATLRAVRGQTPAQAQAALHGLLTRTVVSADPDYRQHLEKLVQENCSTVAALHNSSTPRQRARLAKTLQGYKGDAQALASAS
jgi:hypothetical protein